MKDKFTYRNFLKRYPDDDACLEEIKNLRFPDGIACKVCKKITSHYKRSDKKAYSCQFCGTLVSPLAGTIFHKSSTPLRDWFYAIYLITQTRSGTSAKQLERMLGCTYKTAWRMFKQIRLLMAESSITPLKGEVEVDETYVGGKPRLYEFGEGVKDKLVVMGMVERGGKAYLKHIEGTGKWALIEQIKDHVSNEARVITDEYPSYKGLVREGYKHDFVNHKKTYVMGDIHTQNIENLWSILKRGIYGVYRNVSKKYLQAYIDEYSFRFNNRSTKNMFNTLLSEVVNVKMVR